MAEWKLIAGGLSQISVGSVTNVWGVNAGNIFRYTGDDNNPWIQIPGGLVDVGAAADGTVWGVNAAGNIFRYTWNGRLWVQIDGALTQISAGSKTNVWGVNAGNIFRYTGDDNNPWIQIPGDVVYVSAAADGTVWGVDAAGNTRRYAGRRMTRGEYWFHIFGVLSQISVGSVTNVWGVNSELGNIFWYTGDDNNPWIQIPGPSIPGITALGLVNVSAAADGTVWGVNGDGNIFRYIRS